MVEAQHLKKNRRRLVADLQHQLEVARRYGRPLSIVLAEIEGLAPAADLRTMHAVGRLVNKTKRRADFAARWGECEFIVILPETELVAAQVFAQRLSAAIAAAPVMGQSLSVCAGVNQCNPEDEAVDCLTAAEYWLFRAKQAAPGGVASCLSIMSHVRPGDGAQ